VRKYPHMGKNIKYGGSGLAKSKDTKYDDQIGISSPADHSSMNLGSGKNAFEKQMIVNYNKK